MPAAFVAAGVFAVLVVRMQELAQINSCST